MEETYCIVDKRKTPCTEPRVIKEMKEEDYNFIVNVPSVDEKRLDM